MAEAEKTLSIKFVADLTQPEQALRDFQSEVAEMVFPIGGGAEGEADIPAGGAPNRTREFTGNFGGLFDRSGRAANLIGDELPPRMADLFIPSAQSPMEEYAALGWRGRIGRRMLADETAALAVPALAGGGGEFVPPGRGALAGGAGDESESFGAPRPAWMNLRDEFPGQLPPPRGRFAGQPDLVDAEWAMAEGRALPGGGSWGAGASGGGALFTAPGGGGNNGWPGGWQAWGTPAGGGGGGILFPGLPPGATPWDDEDDDGFDPYGKNRPASQPREGRGESRMGWMGRFVALEAVHTIASLGTAQRQAAIETMLAGTDPAKLAMADLNERNRLAGAAPFGIGELGLNVRDAWDAAVGDPTELSVRQTLESAKDEDEYTKGVTARFERRRAIGEEATIAEAAPGYQRERVREQVDAERAEREARQAWGDANAADHELHQRQAVDETAAARQRALSFSDRSVTVRGGMQIVNWARGVTGLDPIVGDAEGNQYDADVSNINQSETDADTRSAALNKRNYDATVAGIQAIQAAQAQDQQNQRTLTIMGMMAGADQANLRGRGLTFEAQWQDVQSKSLDEYTRAAIAGDRDLMQQAVADEAARWNQVMGEQAGDVNTSTLAENIAKTVSIDKYEGDERAAGVTAIEGQRDLALSRINPNYDPNQDWGTQKLGDQFARKAPSIVFRYEQEEQTFEKQFDDDQYLRDYRQNEQRDIAGLRGRGLDKSANAQSILDNADAEAKGFMRRGGPGDMQRARTAYQTGLGEEEAYQRDLQHALLGGHGVGGIAPGGIGPGFNSTRPWEESAAGGQAAVVAAIKQLQAALTNLH